MPVEIIERNYKSIFRPIDTNVNWLLGNVGVWQTLKIQAGFSCRIDFDSTSQLFIDSPNVLTLSDGSSWNENGFGVGFPIVLQWNYVDTSQNPTVTIYNRVPTSGFLYIDRIENNKAFLVDVNGNPISLTWMVSNILPIESAGFQIKDVSIFSLVQPQGIRFTYGHIENSEYQNGNLTSFIDGSLTEFLAEDTDSMTFGQTLPMQFLGTQSGMSVAFCNLTYVTQSGIDFVYDIEICFMISSFFDNITTFEDDISPPQTFDAKSLTDNFHIVGMPVYNDPNIRIQTDLSSTAKLGNTGWFDENFNGLTNDFVVSSVVYNNQTPVIVSALDYGNTITVTAVIDNVQNLTGQTQCAFGFAWIPNEDAEFKNNEFGFYQNCKMSTGGDAVGFGDVFTVQLGNNPNPFVLTGYGVDAATMNAQNVLFEKTAGNQITFSADFIPTPDFFAFMDAKDITERNYILWVSVADQTEITNKSNRVSLLLDFNQMDTFIEPIGEWDGMTIEFLDHPQDENSVSVPCGNDNRIEDDLLSRIFFQVDTTVADDIPIPLSLTYGIIAERQSDGFAYSLDNFDINLTQFPNPTQYNFSDSRGFKLGAGNNKNFIKAEHWPALDVGSLVGVRGLYGYKIRWEDWIKRLNIPDTVKNDIFDNTQKQDGLSNDWYHYLTTSGYNLYFVVYTNATLGGQVVRYENKKQIIFVDYDANTDITTEFRYYRESDNTLLNGGIDPVTGGDLGVILNNELVRLEIEYTRTTGTWTTLTTVYGLNCIEVDEGIGQMEFRQLSSVWLPELDNPLLPLAGDTLLNIQIISPTVLRATCLIDPTKLIDANRYKITGREGCKI